MAIPTTAIAATAYQSQGIGVVWIAAKVICCPGFTPPAEAFTTVSTAAAACSGKEEEKLKKDTEKLTNPFFSLLQIGFA